MAQTLLPFDFVEAPKHENMTAFAGVGLLLQLLQAFGFRDQVDELFDRGEGWPASVIVTTIILIHVVGGRHISDVHRLMADEGLNKLFKTSILFKLRGKKRRRIKKLIHKTGSSFPSPSSMARFLDQFHDEERLKERVEHKAVIVSQPPAFERLDKLFDELVQWYWKRFPLRAVTLDVDAVILSTQKLEALWTYKKVKGFQPLNFWLTEPDLMLHSEFRDGNVPAGFGLLPALKEALKRMPDGVEELAVRMDSAGYVNELIRYCEEGTDERFGQIYFAITAKMTSPLRKAILGVPEAEWSTLLERPGDDGVEPLETVQQWAEVTYVPNALSTKKSGSFYRFVAVRTPIQNVLALEGTSTPQQLGVAEDPEHVDDALEEQLSGQRYRITAIITNMRHPVGDDPTERAHSQDIPDARRMSGDQAIHWHRERAGRSEHAHSVLKSDLAAGAMPSGKYHVNTLWWAIGIFTMNLLTVFRKHVADPALHRARTKRLRFWYFNVAARVTSAANRIKIRMSSGRRSLLGFFSDAQIRILALAEPPPG